MRIIGVCFTLVFLLACGEGPGDGRDPSATDAGTDSRVLELNDGGGAGGADAQTHSVCGEGPNSTICEFNVEVCRIVTQGGTPMAECVPLPDHCDSDERECDRCAGACVAPQDTCVDDPGFNTVACM